MKRIKLKIDHHTSRYFVCQGLTQTDPINKGDILQVTPILPIWESILIGVNFSSVRIKGYSNSSGIYVSESI